MKAKPTNDPAPRASKAQAQARVEEILSARLDGAEFWDLRELVREKEAEEGSAWHVAEGGKPLSDSQLRRYVARADQLVAESCRASRKKLLRRHLAQRRRLYARAIQTGELGTALSVLRDEAALCGLYPPQKVAPTNPTGNKPYESIALTDAERRAALDRLYASVGAGNGVPVADGQAGAG